MAKRQQAKTVAPVVNDQPMDMDTLRLKLTSFLSQAHAHGSKKEHCTASAVFMLADFIRKDGLPEAHKLLTRDPDVFFSSEEARKPWNDESVVEAYIKPDDNVTKGTFRNIVERAFTLLALHDWLKRQAIVTNPDRRADIAAEYLAIDWEGERVPALAWLATHDKFDMLSNNGQGKYAMEHFGMSKAYAYGFNPKAKGKAAQVTVDFVPSFSGFCANRAAWLNKAEVRKQRTTKGTQAAATVAPVTLRDVMSGAASMLAKADYNVAGEAADAFLDMLKAYIAASDSNRSAVISVLEEAAKEANKVESAAA